MKQKISVLLKKQIGITIDKTEKKETEKIGRSEISDETFRNSVEGM